MILKICSDVHKASQEKIESQYFSIVKSTKPSIYCLKADVSCPCWIFCCFFLEDDMSLSQAICLHT